MVQIKYGNIVIVLAALTLNACASAGYEKPRPAASATVCEDPRPQVCTMDYTPVCATRQDGSVKTYSNGCTACANANVVSWVKDACPDAASFVLQEQDLAFYDSLGTGVAFYAINPFSIDLLPRSRRYRP